MSSPNRHKPPKQDPPIHYSTQHFKEDLQQKGDETTNKEPKPTACLCCNQAHPLYRCNEFKRKSMLEGYEVVKSFKVCLNCLKQGYEVNECSKRLTVKSLSVRDIITVCYTMNMHLSNPLARTHKLSPADSRYPPAIPGNHHLPHSQ